MSTGVERRPERNVNMAGRWTMQKNLKQDNTVGARVVLASVSISMTIGALGEAATAEVARPPASNRRWTVIL